MRATGGRWVALLLLLGLASAAYAAKTDVVHLSNGDALTCEIKILERGRLKVSTDSMDTVYVQWNDVTRITSAETFIVELGDGSRLRGVFAETSAEGKLLLKGDDGERLLDMQDVVWIDPIQLGATRLRRWDGSISAGFDATKANHQTSLTVSLEARRRSETNLINFSASTQSSHRDDASDSTRANFGGSYRRLLEERWFWTVLGNGERNDELGIKMRTLGGAGYGRYITQTGTTLWAFSGGVAANNEQRTGSQGSTNNVEGFLGMDYEYFTYDTPKTSLSVAVTAYPGVTEKGRIRANLNLAWRRELIKDLFVGLSFYTSYDNRPPDAGAKSDYGVVTSLGYSF